MICEKLDRCVANSSWCNLFPICKVTHDFVAYSDHVPLLLDTNGNEQNIKRGVKPFKLEAMWVGEEGRQKIIQDSLEHSMSSMTQVMEKLKEYGD